MNLKSIYRYFSKNIAVGEVAEVSVYGRFLTLLENSGSGNIRVSIAEQPEEELPKGISVELPGDDKFTKLTFRNAGAAQVTIEFSISAGRIYDNRVVISGSLDVNASSDTLETPAAIAVATAAPGAASIAANANRREIILQNNGLNPVWAGDANVDGANDRGTLIDIGKSIVLSCSADIYLRSTGGASTISYMDLRK